MKTIANANGGGVPRDRRFDRLLRWNYLMAQIFECQQFLRFARKRFAITPKSTMDDLMLHLAAFRSFVVSYGKFFRSTGAGRMKLKDLDVFPSGHHLRPTHERLLELRDRFAAHSDASGLEDAHIEVSETEDAIVLTQTFAFGLVPPEYQNFRLALQVVQDYVVDCRDKDTQSLAKRLRKSIVFKDAV